MIACRRLQPEGEQVVGEEAVARAVVAVVPEGWTVEEAAVAALSWLAYRRCPGVLCPVIPATTMATRQAAGLDRVPEMAGLVAAAMGVAEEAVVVPVAAIVAVQVGVAMAVAVATVVAGVVAAVPMAAAAVAPVVAAQVVVPTVAVAVAPVAAAQAVVPTVAVEEVELRSVVSHLLPPCPSGLCQEVEMSASPRAQSMKASWRALSRQA